MADKVAIAKNIRLLALNGRESIDNIIMCTVVSVDGTTCVCQPLDEGQAEIPDVRLVAEESDTNFIITPAVDSIVGVLAFSDLETCEYTIVMFSEIETISIRGDQFGGVVKVGDLVEKLNVLEGSINDLKEIFSTTWVPTPNDGGAALKAAAASWAAAPITETIEGDLENENVKHG